MNANVIESLFVEGTDTRSDLLDRLDGTSAAGLESETLAFEFWDSTVSVLDRRRRIRGIRESVVAMANARGGTIVLGVADRKRTRKEAIHGVGDLAGDRLRRDIYDGTEPHILVDLEEWNQPEGRLLVLRAPRGLPPHTTTDGVAKIRIGKESKPLTGSGLLTLLTSHAGHDPSARVLEDAKWKDLDPAEILRLREVLRSNDRHSLAGLSDARLIEALGLGSDNELTLAAVLLLGRPAALARFAPNHELIFLRRVDATRYDARQDLRAPLLQTIERASELVRNHSGRTTVPVGGLRDLEVPQVSPWVAREAILNALTHRDYFPNASVMVSLYPGRLEISSPGGFPRTVTAENVIRHAPVRRNDLLAGVFRDLGSVDRPGRGVEQIFAESLRAGKRCPYFGRGATEVRLSIPTQTDSSFVQFVDSERQHDRPFGLDDLLVFDALRSHGELDRSSAATALQSEETYAAAHLAALRRRGYLIVRGRGRGTRYRFADRLDALLGGTAVESPHGGSRARRIVLSALAAGKKLTNAEARQLTNGSRHQVLTLMGTLRDEGMVTMEGARGGARYLAGPRLRLETPDFSWPPTSGSN